MKANKITLIAQTVGMYVMHIPLYVYNILELSTNSDSVSESLANGLLIASGVLMALVLPICIANIVLSLVSIGKGDMDLSKTVMVCKLVLIPWYVLNCAMCAIIVAIMFNPFLMFGIPVAISLLMSTAYAFMISTSLPNLAYYIRSTRISKLQKPSAAGVAIIILHFIFCIDVLASILFYTQNKKTQLQPTPTAPISNDLP